MNRPSNELLRRLAEARGIAVRPERMALSRCHAASDGVPLHYLEWPGGPTTIMLIHGGALSAHTFDLAALALGEDVRCIAVDLRGHGLSGWADDYSVDRWVTDTCELIDHLGIDQIHLAGMSLGGCVAGHAAIALGQRLASLSFIDVGPRVNFAASARMRGFIDAVRPAPSVESVVQDALAISPRTDPDLMLYRYQSLLRWDEDGWVWKADRRRPTDFPHILGKLSDLEAIAPRIHQPTLVLKGARSAVLTELDAHQFASRFPAGQVVTIEAGHNVQEDQPVALANALRSTMARSQPADASDANQTEDCN